MPVHDHDSVRETLNEDIYVSSDLTDHLPKYRMPESQHDPAQVFALVRDELMLDGNARQNLATFCQTWAEPEIHEVMDICLQKNMVDRDEYPQTAELEARCVRMIAHLWNAPTDGNALGCSTAGSSEAAMLGGLAMKRRWEGARRAAGEPVDRPNLVTGPVQVCWHKFTRYWDVEHREIPMEEGRLHMSPEEVLKRCDERTIGVVPTLGVTFTGAYEPVQAVADALDRHQAESGQDIPIHVDAASGGFLAPFCAPELAWDFRLPRVRSINASGHKFGLSPLGVGWILWRDDSDLPEEMVFHVNYLGGDMRDIALNFSRPGGQVACQYFTMLRLGREGYRAVHSACYETARFFAAKLEDTGLFEVIHRGEMLKGIPAVSWRLRAGTDPGFGLFDLADRLRNRGWQVPAYTLPAACEETVVQRILVRHGVSRDLVRLLLRDLDEAITHFDRHPVVSRQTASESTGFHH